MSSQTAGSSFFQTWVNALTKPSEQTFAEMASSPNAKATTAYLWVFLGGVVQLVVAFLVQGVAVRRLLEQQGYGGNLPGGGVGFTLISAVCGGPILAVISVVFFAIFTAIVQWIAKMFGGKGTFDQLAYTLAAIATPFSLISAVFVVLDLIPLVGLCFRVLLGLAGLYVFVLEIMAVKGVNQFGWGPAVGSLLIPAAVLFLVCCCLVFAISAAMGAAVGNIFSTINQSLGGGF